MIQNPQGINSTATKKSSRKQKAIKAPAIETETIKDLSREKLFEQQQTDPRIAP